MSSGAPGPRGGPGGAGVGHRRRLTALGRAFNRPPTDNLSHGLHEPRVAAILRPIRMGDPVPSGRDEDVEYSIDLGLIRKESGGLALPALIDAPSDDDPAR